MADDKKKKKSSKSKGPSDEAIEPGLFSEDEMIGKQNRSIPKASTRTSFRPPNLEGKDLEQQVKLYEKYCEKVNRELERSQAKYQQAKEKYRELKKDNKELLATVKDLKKDHDVDLRKVKNEFEDQSELANRYEQKLANLKEEKEEWKDKIKLELRKIKLKDKELENKYELLKRDAQALLDAKDSHILELKKERDKLDLDLESAEDKLIRNDRILSVIGSKKSRLVETLNLAISLLEALDREEEDSESQKAG